MNTVARRKIMIACQQSPMADQKIMWLFLMTTPVISTKKIMIANEMT